MRMLAILAVSLAFAAIDAPVEAQCIDPLGCWVALCQEPGNVLELTMIGVEEQGFWRARVDAVHLVAERFTAPAVGTEVTLSPHVYGGLGVAPGPGEPFVAVAASKDNAAWITFAVDDHGVSCASGFPTNHLTIEEMATIIESGDCSSGDPLPKPLTKCNDTDIEEDGCTSGGVDLSMALVVLALLARYTTKVVQRR